MSNLQNLHVHFNSQMEVNFNRFSINPYTVEICDFERHFLSDSRLFNFSLNFTKVVAFKR